jgi:hypothetical protein
MRVLYESSEKMHGLNLDEMIPPLVVLMVRLAEDVNARIQMQEWILPAGLDRTQSLEGRGDTLGRCILRLLASVYYMRLKDAIGEWMFALCDNDGLMLSSQIGYGNAAGYLFNKGILSAPPSTSSTTTTNSTTVASRSNAASTSDGSSGGDNNNINPITGMVNREVEDDIPEMTDEEKE